MIYTVCRVHVSRAHKVVGTRHGRVEYILALPHSLDAFSLDHPRQDHRLCFEERLRQISRTSSLVRSGLLISLRCTGLVNADFVGQRNAVSPGRRAVKSLPVTTASSRLNCTDFLRFASMPCRKP